MNFINHKLNEADEKAFIEHIRSCKDCREELEIYYIMLIGMRQLDEGEELTADFKKRLTDEIDCRYEAIERRRKREALLRAAVIAFFTVGSFWTIIYFIGDLFF